MLGLVEAVKAYERLTVRAAVAGDRDLALKALMAHPLVADYRRRQAAAGGAARRRTATLLPRFAA